MVITFHGSGIGYYDAEKEEYIFNSVTALLGKSVKVYLNAGGSFNFKITGCGQDHINGYDDESNQLHINIEDIDFIRI
jgi:hypothetical protein